MTTVPFLDLGAMHNDLVDEAVAAFEKIVRSNAFVLGEDVRLFEEEFASFCETQYAVGVDSGLSALELALRAFDIQPGDEVIVPANTFIATAAAVVFIGAKPVFVDITPGTYKIDLNKLEACITARTRAIIPVHLYGSPENMEPILAFAHRHNLIVIEDASQAHGARYHGKRVGSLGDMGAFSLYPGKNLGAFGEAGVITTNDPQMVEKIKAMRNCGQTQKYHHFTHPYNRRLDTVQAAVLRLKLRRLDGWNACRQQVAHWYGELLAGTHLVLPAPMIDAEPVWHLYVVQTPQRDALMQFLKDKGIATGIHYPIPIHLSPVYDYMGHKRGDFPVTEEEADRILSLPMFPTLTREQVQYIAEAVREFESQSGLNTNARSG